MNISHYLHGSSVQQGALVCPPLPISCIYHPTVMTHSRRHQRAHRELKTFFTFCLLCHSPLSHFLSPSPTCAHARSHQHIGLDYNLICSGRDGIEHQIIPNEENQSPRCR